MANIIEIEHPLYTDQLDDWTLFRLTGMGGDAFLDEYLTQRTGEENANFEERKSLSYVPAFAKSSLQQINNSLRQRLTAVVRSGGSDKYRRAIKGFDGGVDRQGSTMNRFIGGDVLFDLTMMGGIGIYLDAPANQPETIQDDLLNVPYLYTYKREDIKSWATDETDTRRFVRLLLRDNVEVTDEDFALTIDYTERYRYYSIEDDGFVHVRFFDADGEEDPERPEQVLTLTEIPFVYLTLSSSIISDVCRYQIALLNIGSTDVSFAWKSNLTFYAEQYDPNAPENYFGHISNDETDSTEAEEATVADEKEPNKRILGHDKGIKVAKGLDYPTYIGPDPGPLRASIDKQAQLKSEIYELINQTLKTVSSKSSSAESKRVDERREEDGLKAIGDELEFGENRIATFWAMYEGSQEPAEVRYPENYEFKSDDERRKEAKELSALMLLTSSTVAQKEYAKQVITVTLENKVPESVLQGIHSEIDSSTSPLADPEWLNRLVENDVLSPGTVAKQLGFPEAEAAKAAAARVERAKEIADVQGVNKDNPGARGVSDLSVNPKGEARDEKREVDQGGP